MGTKLTPNQSNPLYGLTEEEAEISRERFGTNQTEFPPIAPLWKRFFRGLLEPCILILLAAFLIQIILLILGEASWFEPAGVALAILIADTVSAISGYRGESRTRALLFDEAAAQLTKVVREGVLKEILAEDVVVGDILEVEAGDVLCAAGEMISGKIVTSDAAITGESDEIPHIPEDVSAKVLRGAVVMSGTGFYRVTEVGEADAVTAATQDRGMKTPLQQKLAKLAKQIAVVGYVGAVCIFLCLLVRTLVADGAPADGYAWIRLFTDAITAAVTIVICVVPEGLPMLTSLLLSYQSRHMAKENVLVRSANGLEAAGNLQLLFSDKTGTITEGNLAVTEFFSGDGTDLLPTGSPFDAVTAELAEDFRRGIGVNNGAVLSEGKIIGGNSTDRALLRFLSLKCGMRVTEKFAAARREADAFQEFDSAVKYSGVTISGVTYCKGAPEKILPHCRFVALPNGGVRSLSAEEIESFWNPRLNEKANACCRCIAISKVAGEDPTADGGTLLAILCMRDKIRTDAPKSIAKMRSAGVQVVLLTGDRRETAVAIAKDVGLFSAEDGGEAVVTSAELAEYTDREILQALPRWRVVARALPADKSRLCRIARSASISVGMVGDGVNDAPAMAASDCSFALGSGSARTRAAADLLLCDDNFRAIPESVRIGRTIDKNIAAFLRFQLSGNVVAVLIDFIGAAAGAGVMLGVVQMLLLNLALDTLAALAFGAEPPQDAYLKEKPLERTAPILTRETMIHIAVTGGVIAIVCLLVCFLPATPLTRWMGDPASGARKTALFATFLISLTLSGFGMRPSSPAAKSAAPLQALRRNPIFPGVAVVLILATILCVQFGGALFGCTPLSATAWGCCIVAAIIAAGIATLCSTAVTRLFRRRKPRRN